MGFFTLFLIQNLIFQCVYIYIWFPGIVLISKIHEWEDKLTAAYMARNRCLAFCWKYVQLGYISGLALPYCFLRRTKKHIQTCAAFCTSREVPVVTENRVFSLFALHCRAAAAPISSEVPVMLRGNLELWEFFCKVVELGVVSIYFPNIELLNESEERMFVNALKKKKMFIKELFIGYEFQQGGKIKGGNFRLFPPGRILAW